MRSVKPYTMNGTASTPIRRFKNYLEYYGLTVHQFARAMGKDPARVGAHLERVGSGRESLHKSIIDFMDSARKLEKAFGKFSIEANGQNRTIETK